MKNVLLIEDEAHKRDELAEYLEEFVGPDMSLDVVDSVRDAVICVSKKNFELIILDMALPTFTTDGGKVDGGLDQSLGGVEVLRTLRSLSKKANVIIVTQYPDITLDGKRVRLKAAQSALARKYGQKIIGAVLYKYKSSMNRSKLKSVLDTVW